VRPLIVFVLVSVTAQAQDFITLSSRASTLYHNGEYLRSALTYDSALRIDNSNNITLYDAACSWALVGEGNKAVRLLRDSFAKGWPDFHHMYHDRDLTLIRNHPDYLALEKKYRPPNTVYLFDVIRALNANTIAWFEDKEVMMDEGMLVDYTLADIERRVGPVGRRTPADTLLNFSDRSLEFRNCNFKSPYGNSNVLRFLRLGTISYHDCQGYTGLWTMSVNHMVFIRPRSDANQKLDILLRDVKQQGVFKLHANGDQVVVENTVMRIRIPEGEKILFHDGDADEFNDRNGMHFHPDHKSIRLSNVDIDKADDEMNVMPLELIVGAETMQMSKVRLGYKARLSGKVTESLRILDSRFPDSFDMFGLQFPSENVLIPFDQFRDTRFVLFDIRDDAYSVEGDSLADIVDDKFSDNQTRLHKALYDNYRDHADLASANACYVRLKELEIEHLKAKEGKGLEERMRLWLNVFMGFYTNHATSPGRGIIVSFWIVILFAVFYFFFPSDWDLETKAKLAHDFRIFVEKNEHGYVRPFFKLLGGMIVSFLNALTLSMNAFITLGFGSIPTTGIPRYVCVLQGVLGWFLLTLFTVALLNQVLL